MKLIRNLPTRISKIGRRGSWAKFLCEYCNMLVERRLSNGLRDKSCGCEKENFIAKAQINNINGKLYNSGYYTQKELAEKFNINKNSINQIINNKI